MNTSVDRFQISTRLKCIPVAPSRPVPDVAEDVRIGLLEPPRFLPPKYFYDATGSDLFSRICKTPEYYPTRTEDQLLARHSVQIISEVLPEQILELGSGSSQKTRRLFNACETVDHSCSYAPFDVCADILEQTASNLQIEYDWLDVLPLQGDYHAGLGNLPDFNGRRLFVFLGSTIGNFNPEEASEFLSEINSTMSSGDYLLLGADRVKDNQVLNAAYNDNAGITAEFNLNLLQVLNRELDANFYCENFRHVAFFNEKLSRIEMRLVSIKNHTVELSKLEETISFEMDDEILTEISHKYTFESAENLFAGSEFDICRHFEPDNRFFSLILARCK